MATPLGAVEVAGRGGVSHLAWVDDVRPGGEDPLGVGAAIAAWFEGRLDALDGVGVEPAGTAYQQRVWAAVRGIPAGQTRSYGELARELGSVARAVGQANAANPVALIIPCHRVVGGRGALVGYAFGVERKKWLLDHEQGVRPLLGGAL